MGAGSTITAMTRQELAEKFGLGADSLRKAGPKAGVQAGANDLLSDEQVRLFITYYAGVASQRATAQTMWKPEWGVFPSGKGKAQTPTKERKAPTRKKEKEIEVGKMGDSERQGGKPETETAENNWPFWLCVSAAVLLLSVSVHSVGDVLCMIFPLNIWVACGFAFVVCTSPIMVVTATKAPHLVSWVLMLLAFGVEVFCNIVAIEIHLTPNDLTPMHRVFAVNDIAVAYVFGVVLPLMALLFEITILKIKK